MRLIPSEESEVPELLLRERSGKAQGAKGLKIGGLSGSLYIYG